jgi:hypothetical protein
MPMSLSLIKWVGERLAAHRLASPLPMSGQNPGGVAAVAKQPGPCRIGRHLVDVPRPPRHAKEREAL